MSKENPHPPCAVRVHGDRDAIGIAFDIISGAGANVFLSLTKEAMQESGPLFLAYGNYSGAWDENTLIWGNEFTQQDGWAVFDSKESGWEVQLMAHFGIDTKPKLNKCMVLCHSDPSVVAEVLDVAYQVGYRWRDGRGPGGGMEFEALFFGPWDKSEPDNIIAYGQSSDLGRKKWDIIDGKEINKLRRHWCIPIPRPPITLYEALCSVRVAGAEKESFDSIYARYSEVYGQKIISSINSGQHKTIQLTAANYAKWILPSLFLTMLAEGVKAFEAIGMTADELANFNSSIRIFYARINEFANGGSSQKNTLTKTLYDTIRQQP